MSSKAKKLSKQTNKPDELYNTLVGSIICTVGKLCKKAPQDCRKLFLSLKENPQVLPKTVEGICNYVWTVLGDEELKCLRNQIVLVTDKNNVRTPMVTLCVEDCLVPVNPNGWVDMNILSLANEGRDWIDVEYVYDENGNSYAPEET